MTQQREDWRRRGSTPVRTTVQDQTKTSKDPDIDRDSDQDLDQDSAHSGPSRPQRPHRVLVQSASYQPGDSLRYRSRWLQELDRDLDWDLDRDLDQDSDQDGYRVVLIGDHDVGKSSLASVFAGTSGRDQEENQEQTFEKTLTVDGEDTTLRVMDTWDPNRTVRTIQEQSLSTPCTAYILVYSVADRCTFEAAAELRITVRRARQNERVPIIIVGNKSDLVRAREVTTQEGLACAVVFDCKFIETSASLHHNVLELFEGVVRQIRLHRDTQANMLMLTLTPRYSHKRKESLTQKARRLLHRVMSNQRVSVRARSKSCHDLAVL
ncbi:GTP-binding protein REM 1-like [Periophthalmus magnuspinnatus]|uniref:GTP-binding protein REM 1-like n=1 Tax=Periophthalmus magnuspinnatus TaxID=409849 RepID=UPI0024371700|nr:GTP-binding protein REM 1-like [Periophthalmus magnuspinnatus]